MLLDYVNRAPRLTGKTHQWIQGQIKKGENQSTCNEAFNYFLEELERGENLLNAKRNAQGKYGVSIEYDTAFPESIHEKSTLVVLVEK